MTDIFEIVRRQPGMIRQLFYVKCAGCENERWYTIHRYKGEVAYDLANRGWVKYGEFWYCLDCAFLKQRDAILSETD